MEKSEGGNSYASKNVDRMRRQIQFENDSDRYRNVKQAVRDAFLHMMIIIIFILSFAYGVWESREVIQKHMVKFDKWVEKK